MKELDTRTDKITNPQEADLILCRLVYKYSMNDLYKIMTGLQDHWAYLQEETEHAEENMTLAEGRKYLKEILSSYNTRRW